MEKINEILKSFRPITLEEMDGVELMNRTDTKFMLSLDSLLEILPMLNASYRVLEINEIRQSHYETLYYDTHDFHFYKRHLNGKRNRYKIRKRSYVDSNLTFLEVKFKNNKDRTIKNRTKLALIGEELEEKSINFIEKTSGIHEELEPKLWNRFKRITLVNDHLAERLTIDCELSFKTGDTEIALPNLVIAEVKQEKQNRHSTFMVELKRRIIRSESISKYCLGATLLFPNLKSNSFKPKILKIKKIENGIAA